MSTGLLDVNVLIALAWPSHIQHAKAHAWMLKNMSRGWATCPITQCGFVRISSNPRIIPEAVSPTEAVALLEQFTLQPGHVFWPEILPLQHEAVPLTLVAGYKQVTDAYLLGLAVHHGGKLITFDAGLASLLPTRSPHMGTLEVIR